VPPEQANVALEHVSTDLDNGNIPKSSLIALSQSIESVLESRHIGSRLKRSLTCGIFGIYFDLRVSRHNDYAQTLLCLLTQVRGYRRERDLHRIKALASIFEEEKSEYRMTRSEQHVRDLESALSQQPRA
jgi:hypothetical protein